MEPEEEMDMDQWHPDRPYPLVEMLLPNDDSDFIYHGYNDGMLSLCNWGCGESTELVVTGEDYGHIWFLDPDHQTAIPEKHPDGTRLNFLDWYDLWLDGRDEVAEIGKLITELL